MFNHSLTSLTLSASTTVDFKLWCHKHYLKHLHEGKKFKKKIPSCILPILMQYIQYRKGPRNQQFKSSLSCLRLGKFDDLMGHRKKVVYCPSTYCYISMDIYKDALYQILLSQARIYFHSKLYEWITETSSKLCIFRLLWPLELWECAYSRWIFRLKTEEKNSACWLWRTSAYGKTVKLLMEIEANTKQSQIAIKSSDLVNIQHKNLT